MNLFDSLPPKGTQDRAQEAALAKRIARGDEEAIGELVMANMREAMLYARAVSRNVDDGLLMSICYEALVRNAKRFNPRLQRFLAFAKAGLRGAFYRHYNKEQAVLAPLVSVDAYKEPDDDDDAYKASSMVMSQTAQPEFDLIFTRDRWSVVEPILKTHCSEQEQMVLTLTYISGFNFQETGNLLGISRSAVHRTHVRAIKKIREELGSKTRLLDE